MATRVAVLGATGAVGQRLVQLLDPHPEFEIAALTASASSAGRTYTDAAKWRLETPIPDGVADVTVDETDPDAVPDDVALCFSSLPSDVAGYDTEDLRDRISFFAGVVDRCGSARAVEAFGRLREHEDL